MELLSNAVLMPRKTGLEIYFITDGLVKILWGQMMMESTRCDNVSILRWLFDILWHRFERIDVFDPKPDFNRACKVDA